MVIKRILFILFIVCFAILYSSGQEIDIRADNRPLNVVLTELRDTYQVQLSFDDRQLAKYKLTLNDSFATVDAAVDAIITGFPLNYEKSGDVYIIFHVKKSRKTVRYHLAGQVMEATTLEPLPFSHVIINNMGTVTDLKGSFAFVSETDSVFQVKASYLGYYINDTILAAGVGHKILLIPSSIGLSEIVIKERAIEKAMQIGNQAGVMKLNHKVANFLPGYGDNSVFNLLRLQPGVLASGEQTNELIIWGSYAGHSQVLFDGFTIYGLKNFNDNISAFNPFVAKDLEIFKGGFDASLGERVGGIVNITGKNGSTSDPSFTFCINNMTLNGIMEVPLFKTSSLLVSFRQTYYNLYDPKDFSFSTQNPNNPVDIRVVPDYMFRDINIKYSARIRDRDLFYISLYGGRDQFEYTIDQQVFSSMVYKNTKEKNRQTGGSIFYGKTWRNGNTSNFTLAMSKLNSQYFDIYQIEKLISQETEFKSDENTSNGIDEFTVHVDNRFVINESHTLEGGIGLIVNKMEMTEDTFNVTEVDVEAESGRLNLFLQDRMSLGPNVSLTAGFRTNYGATLKQMYFEPRISFAIRPNDFWTFTMAWGKYNQFISKTSIVDELGNYRYLWTVCDNENIPVLRATHYVAGLSFQKNNFTFNLDGYFKNTYGLTRYIRILVLNFEDIFEGEARSYGIDIMVKKDFKRHSGWVAYTLGKTEEHFSYFRDNKFRRAPQDQRHELKVAALLNFDPIFFSANYVFGSGFPENASYQPSETPDNLRYSRLDVSIIYAFLDRKVRGEVGLSVLNVLDTENIKYANFERIPSYLTNSINIHAEAIPFTPALYLKFAM